MIEIVTADESYAPAIAEIEQECFSEPMSENQLKSVLNNPLTRAFAAVENGRLAGYSMMENVAGECYVDNIAVTAEYRGRGIGRLLTEKLVETSENESCEFITLEVRESNIPAISLYESLGFVQEGKRKAFYSKPTEDGLILTRREGVK